MRVRLAIFTSVIAMSGGAEAAVSVLSPGDLISRVSINAATPLDNTNRNHFDKPFVSDSMSVATPSSQSSASAYAVLDARGAPSISVGGIGNASGGNSSSAAFNVQGYLFYQFVIQGPTEAVPVHFDASGWFETSGATQGSFGSRAGIIFDVQGLKPGGGLFRLIESSDVTFGTAVSGGQIIQTEGSGTVSGNSSTGFSGAFEVNATYNLATNTVYTVQLIATAEGYSFWNNVPGGAFLASAFVDPVFSIAVGTPDANLYSFAFSPGVGNGPVSAVPEPSTWAMLLIGFAGLGVAARRRQRESAFA